MNPQKIKLIDKPSVYAEAMKTLNQDIPAIDVLFTADKNDRAGILVLLNEAKNKLTGDSIIDFVAFESATGTVSHHIFIDKFLLGSVNSVSGAEPHHPGRVNFVHRCGNFNCKSPLDALEMSYLYIQKNLDLFSNLLAVKIREHEITPNKKIEYTKDQIHAQIRGDELIIINDLILTNSDVQKEIDKQQNSSMVNESVAKIFQNDSVSAFEYVKENLKRIPINELNDDGISPFLASIMSADEKCFDLFILNGADLNQTIDNSRYKNISDCLIFYKRRGMMKTFEDLGGVLDYNDRIIDVVLWGKSGSNIDISFLEEIMVKNPDYIAKNNEIILSTLIKNMSDEASNKGDPNFIHNFEFYIKSLSYLFSNQTKIDNKTGAHFYRNKILDMTCQWIEKKDINQNKYQIENLTKLLLDKIDISKSDTRQIVKLMDRTLSPLSVDGVFNFDSSMKSISSSNNISQKDINSNTLATSAAKLEKITVLEHLIKRDISIVNDQDENGKKPIDIAKENGNVKMFKILEGKDNNKQKNKGNEIGY